MTDAQDFLLDQEELACVMATRYPKIPASAHLREQVIDSLRCAVLDNIVTLDDIAELICRKQGGMRK